MLRFAFPFATTFVVAAGTFFLNTIEASAQNTGSDAYAPETASENADFVLPSFSLAPVTSAKWVATISANAAVGPAFIGADRSKIFVFPSVNIRRGGQAKRPLIPGDSFSFDLLDNKYVSFGPVGRFKVGRYYADNRKLAGLRKLPWTIEGGAFLEIWPTYNLRGRIEARHGFRKEDGWVIGLGADYVQTMGQFVFTIGPRANWASHKVMRNTFGVTAQEASLNNLAYPKNGMYAYSPKSGFQSAGVSASLNYQISDEWSVNATASYSRLINDAGRSPIVKRLGKRNQYDFGLEASYSLGIN